MSISDNYLPIKQQGNGVSTQFSGLWDMLDASFAVILLEDVISGVQTTVPPSDYTLVFTPAGFTVTFNVAPSIAYYVVIGRNVTQDQQTPYATSTGFDGNVIEKSFDLIVAITQDLQDQINRSPKAPIGTNVNLNLPVPNPGKALLWNNTGTDLINSTDNFDDIVPDAEAAAAAAQAAAGSASSSAGTATTAAAAALAAQMAAEAAANGLKYRSARMATTANITLSGLQTIDGVVGVSGDVVLVKNQAAPAQNGVYNMLAGAWTRTTDSDTWDELVSQCRIIQEGTVNADQLWVCTADQGGTIGVTAVNWIPLPSFIADGSIAKVKFTQDALYNGVRITTTTPYVVVNSDDSIEMDASGGAKTITMPTASAHTGRNIKIQKTDSSFNVVTITGVTTLNTQNETVLLVSNGTSWIVKDRFIPTSWTTYTTTLTHTSGGITNNTNTFKWRRIGDMLEVIGNITFSAASAAFTGLNFSIPSGLSVDNARLPSGGSIQDEVGGVTYVDAGTAINIGRACYFSSTAVVCYVINVGATYAAQNAISNTIPFTFNTSDGIYVSVRLPISGWN